jgi:thiamine kinase-like enzyme
VTLEACLPEALRGPATTITRVAAGLSGASVYRVDAGGDAFVLKVSDPNAPLSDWRLRLGVQRSAAAAGLAPEVVHADESNRAVLSRFVAGEPFLASFRDPSTHDAALALLGQTVRLVHQLPIVVASDSKLPLEYLAGVWSGVEAGRWIPPWVRETMTGVLAEAPPPGDLRLVMSHNDLNPSNLVRVGQQLLLFDWDASGPNDSCYDLGTLALFLRLDDDACRSLLTAYEGTEVAGLPARFRYNRRLAAAVFGATFLYLAHRQGQPIEDGDNTLEATPTLGECYDRIRAGTLRLASPEGQWLFGLAMMRELNDG